MTTGIADMPHYISTLTKKGLKTKQLKVTAVRLNFDELDGENQKQDNLEY